MKQPRSWKDHLLSSGLPLEHSVAEALLHLGLPRPTEFKYERIDREGVRTFFSIDIHSTKIFLNLQVWVELFIECKYRHDGTTWVFTPDSFEAYLVPERQDLLIGIDHLLPHRKLSTEPAETLSRQYPICGKGIELLHNDANPKSIREAVQQLRFAIVHRVVDAMKHQAQEITYGRHRPPVYVFVPIIVTTAELWRLRTQITIENIRAAAELREVADRCSTLISLEQPDNELIRHSKQHLHDGITGTALESINRYLAVNNASGFDGFVNMFADYYPSLFFVVEFTELNSLLERIFRLLSSPEAVTQQDNSGAGDDVSRAPDDG